MGVDVQVNVSEAEEKIKKSKEDRLKEIGRYMVEQLEQALEGEGSGRTYRVPGTNILYQASAPGEFPAERTSQLRNSNFFVVDGDMVGIGTPLEYGLFLEVGTYKMAPRPWINPTFRANLDVIKSIAGQGWL